MQKGKVKIFLMDTNKMMRQGLRRLIGTQPGLVVVGEAVGGQAAMDRIRVSGAQVVLLDFDVAGECGVENTRRIREKFPAVKVIVVSSDLELKLVIQALHAGVAGCVAKEQGFDELIRAIQAVMADRLYLSPEVASAVIRDFMKHSHGAKRARAGVPLSDRERLLLQLVAEGKRNKEIAEEMGLAVKSVETYRGRLMKKLACAGTAELVRYAIREDIIAA